MCGIVGYTGHLQAAPILLDGLSKLEYRGYDSAGLAVRNGEKKTEIVKAKGRLKSLAEKTDNGNALIGTCGIGHTRWATHGEPSETNAHPHMSDDGNVVGVHNGIIENYQELKEKLIRKGYSFYSSTDTEVAVKLIDYYYKKYEHTPVDAINHALVRIRGSYALAMMFEDYPGEIYVARKDSPMILGVTDGDCFVASDVPAILKYTRTVYYIGNLEMARMADGAITFYNLDGDEIEKQPTQIEWDAEAAEKAGFEHFMIKEIHEQPKAVRDTINSVVKDGAIDLSDVGLTEEQIKNISQIYIVACGSAYHVGVACQYVFEDLAEIPVRVELASEFRYRKMVLDPNGLVIIVSQSGETADSLAALRLAKKKGFERLSGFVNGVLRTITRNKEEILNSESAFWQELQKNPVRALSVRYSVPEWMISLWEAQYGEEKTEPMLERLKNGRPLTIRLDSRLTEEEKAQEIAAIEAEGVTVQKHQLYADAWNLEGCEGIGHLPGFAEGLFYAQDVSSMLAVEAAGIAGGMTVMDLCSAPGGKTTLAARKAGSGKVICGDVSERKAALILENTDRMKCSNVSVNVWDASVFMEQYKESADVVLLDVPCSGLGVIGRKKEIRYRVTKEDLAALVTLQKKIVDACWQYVKPGGILLYSTCTLDVSENEEMVRYVTEKYPFEAESIDPFLPECLHSQQTKAGFLQLFLGEWDTDGFFMARLRRKK